MAGFPAADKIIGEGYTFKQAKLQSEREERSHKEKMLRYQKVLDRYNEERSKAKAAEGFFYPKLVPPFQMAIPDDYKLDFSKGLGDALSGVKDKFVEAILVDIKPQLRDHLNVDPFMHSNGDAKLGITLYMLNEQEMMDLEDAIKEAAIQEYLEEDPPE
jgi:hypothetical protein